MYINSNVTE